MPDSDPENAPKASPSNAPNLLRHFRNWLSLLGLIIVAGSIFAFLLLLVFDFTTKGSNPYVGILTYIVAPTFFFLGNALAAIGWLWNWKRRREPQSLIHFDLSRLKDRRLFMLFIAAGLLFLLVSSVGSYQTYTYTNSNQFCATACHSVMEPQGTAYEYDVHSKVSCVECHVGPGPKGTFKAKWHGLYKVYSLSFDKYPKPLDADPHYLPATQDSCLKCHDTQEIAQDDVAHTYHHYLSDRENTPFSVSLRLKLSPDPDGATPTKGIHWHAQPENAVEFTTSIENPNVIPWIKATNQAGQSAEYKFVPPEDALPEDVPDLSKVTEPTLMSCFDCHSRPAHGFPKPNDLIEEAMRRGTLDKSLPELKYVIAQVFEAEHVTQADALLAIETELKSAYKKQDAAIVNQAIASAQELYARSIFPHMKADWRSYPDFIGHKDNLGCFRCHDDKHVSLDGTRVLSAKNCSSCHDVIAQGDPKAMTLSESFATEFDHPDGSYLGFTCADCHTGGLQRE